MEASLGLGTSTGTGAGEEIDSDATVEADSWQRALQSARALRGERSPMSGFSTETLSDGGFRAVDPIKRITFTVRPAGNDATLGVHKAPKAAPSGPAIVTAGASSTGSTSGPPRPNVQTKSPMQAVQAVQSVQAAQAMQAVKADTASATLLDAVPPPSNLALDDSGPKAALDPDATDETLAAMPMPSGPSAPAPAPALAPVILFRREQAPSPAAPLHYREYVIALPPGTTEDEAEAALRNELARLQHAMANEPAGKLVNLAAFDEMFTGPPSSLPLVTLTWKDWRGDPVIDRPRRRGTALPVQPMSFPPPAPSSASALEAPEIVHVPPMPKPVIASSPALAELAAALPESIEEATAESLDIPIDVSEPRLSAAAPVSVVDVVEEEQVAAPTVESVTIPEGPEVAAIAAIADMPASASPSDEEPALSPPGALPAMRRQADSLIGGLFEQMHDLAFLKDSIEGADFCLMLALQELPALAGVVYLYDMERRVFEVIAVRGDAAQGRLHTTTPDGDPRFRTAAREGVARGQSEAPRANATSPASLTRFTAEGNESLLAPIVKDGRYLGAIELVGSKDGAPLGDGETNALTYIASQYAEFVSSRGTKFKASVAKMPARPPIRGR